ATPWPPPSNPKLSPRGATRRLSSWSTSATIRFARLMISISRADLSEITALNPQSCGYTGANLVDFPDAVELSEQSPLAIITDQRRGLVLVNLQAVRDRLFPIILALIKLPATAVAHSRLFRRIEYHVRERAAVPACSPAGQSLDNRLLRHLNRQHMVQAEPHLSENRVETLCLGNGPRKTIQDKSRFAIFFFQPLGDQIDDHAVRHQSATIDIFRSLFAQRSLLRHGFAQNVARRNLACAKLLLEPFRLGSLPSAR